jgi:NADPH-dependent 2,4-dienoyl-CoA reductase/sulfur reductase-like enzyme
MKGFAGRITIIGAEAHPPYDRPPLSKEHLAADSSGTPVPLLSDEALEALNADFRLATEATSLSPDAPTVRLGTGDAVAYDTLVVATGSRARTLPLDHGLAGFLVLRTREDADALRAALDRRPRVAVLGGGFIGAEVASAARARGLDVTIVEMLPAPMSRALGTQVGALLGRLHEDHGVTLRCGTTVVGATGRNGTVESLDLADGSVVRADVVVVGLGAAPQTEWLAGSGLDLTNGVLCDSSLRAVGRPDVYAAGDVARWRHPTLGRDIRVEHWTSAQEHASVVAGGIMGEEQVAAAIPYVWSDQYGRRLQIIGQPTAGHDVTVVEDAAGGRHMAVYENEGRVTAMVTIDAPKVMMQGRRAIANGEAADQLLARI